MIVDSASANSTSTTILHTWYRNVWDAVITIASGAVGDAGDQMTTAVVTGSVWSKVVTSEQTCIIHTWLIAMILVLVLEDLVQYALAR